jgi:hypothetical protein
MSTKKPTGELFTQMNPGGLRTVMYAIVTPKPLALTTYINAGTPATDIVLGYKPAGTSVTLANTGNYHTKAGVPSALTSVTVSTGVAVKPSAGAAGDKDIVLYETDFEAIAA